jgi:Mn2+/Fe2+ NRAMP family transporter
MARWLEMTIFTRLYYQYRKIIKAILLLLMISGPGIIVMIADNDAGGIATYTATGEK